jgi:hypothetical protein
MAGLAELLDYDQRKKQLLQSAIDQYSKGYGVANAFTEGLADQAKGMGQMVMHPIDTAKQLYEGGKAAIQNPQAALQAAKEGLTEAVSSPENIARFAGQNFNPMDIANALNKVGGMRNIYLPTRPKMPAEVGTRYTTTDVGGLLPKKPFNIEEHKGSSILITPWDLSSRNRLITSVSDDALLNAVLTHGGQQYARDILHQAQNIAGASGGDIVKRIADRIYVARNENLAQGGTGKILNTPITMGGFSENYSVMPTQIMMDFIDRKAPSKEKIEEINSFIRNGVPGHKPYPTFKGIETQEGIEQLLSGGHGIDAAGQLRKKFIDAMYKEKNEKYFGFNRQDVSNAITDPDLLGVGRGYGLNTVISHGDQPLILTPSTNLTYPTNFSGEYAGSLGNVPVQEFMPGVFKDIAKEYANSTYTKGKDIGKPWTPSTTRDAVIGALEKRKSGVSQIINDEVINRVGEYLRNQQAR